MREMTIRVLCDRCNNPVEGADGSHDGTIIAYGNSGQLRVDLCGDCHQALFEMLQPVLSRGLRYPSNGQSESGRKPMPPRVRVHCPRCGKQVSMGAGMTLHARKVHPEVSESLLVAEATRQSEKEAVS